MKKILMYLTVVSFVPILFSCQKNQIDLIDSTSNYPKPPANYVKSSNLQGTLKGTLKKDSTYYLVGSVVVNPSVAAIFVH